jgi:hypothetical protein
MNKRGAAFLGIITAIIIFMAGALMIEHYKDTITSTRTTLDCSNYTGISDGTKLVCLEIDLLLPYFILTLLSIAGGFIAETLT